MKVLLLGAKGMLGQALAREFGGEDLTAWDRDELDITDKQQVQERIAALRSTFAEASVFDSEAQTRGADRQAHDFVIINAAAYTAVDDAERNRDVAFLVNETGVRNIAAVAKEIDATVVHYSTDYVFDGTKQGGYSEDDKPGPAVNVYGESKLAGEVALRESGVRFFLIRTAWLYGVGGKNFVDTMLKLADEKEELRVINDQHGSPTWASDLAQVTHQLLESKTYAAGIYHAVNSGMTTWYEFAQAIMDEGGKTARVIPVTSAEFPRPAKRPAYSVLRNTRGPVLRPWREALKEYIKERKSG